MEEKVILNTILNLSKNMGDLLLHGTIESNDDVILKRFNNSLNSYLDIQSRIFRLMEEKGYYKLDSVEDKKIKEIREKYSN